MRIQVSLPAALARAAEAAWLRDDHEDRMGETPAVARTRGRAATWALIGRALHERGHCLGDEVTVDLNAWVIGRALDAAEELGLLDG